MDGSMYLHSVVPEMEESLEHLEDLQDMPWSRTMRIVAQILSWSMLVPGAVFGLSVWVLVSVVSVKGDQNGKAQGMGPLLDTITCELLTLMFFVICLYKLVTSIRKRMRPAQGYTPLSKERFCSMKDLDVRTKRGAAELAQLRHSPWKSDDADYDDVDEGDPAFLRLAIFSCAIIPLVLYLVNVFTLYWSCRHACHDVVGHSVWPNCTPSSRLYQEELDKCRHVCAGDKYSPDCLKNACMDIGLVRPQLYDLPVQRANLCKTYLPGWPGTRSFWIRRYHSCEESDQEETTRDICAQVLLGVMPPSVCGMVSDTSSGLLPFESKLRSETQMEKAIFEEPLICVVICALLGAAHRTISSPRSGKDRLTRLAENAFWRENRKYLPEWQEPSPLEACAREVNASPRGGTLGAAMDGAVGALGSDGYLASVATTSLTKRAPESLQVSQIAAALVWSLGRVSIPLGLRYAGLLGSKDVLPLTLLSPMIFLLSWGMQIFTYRLLFLRFCQVFNAYCHVRDHLHGFNMRWDFAGTLEDDWLRRSRSRLDFTVTSISHDGDIQANINSLIKWEKLREFIQLHITDKRMAVELHLVILLTITSYHLLRTAYNVAHDIDWHEIPGRWGVINFTSKPTNIVTLFDSVFITVMLMKGLFFARSLNVILEGHVRLLESMKSHLEVVWHGSDGPRSIEAEKRRFRWKHNPLHLLDKEEDQKEKKKAQEDEEKDAEMHKFQDTLDGVISRIKQHDERNKQRLLGLVIDQSLLNRLGTLIAGYLTTQAFVLFSSLESLTASTAS